MSFPSVTGTNPKDENHALYILADAWKKDCPLAHAFISDLIARKGDQVKVSLDASFEVEGLVPQIWRTFASDAIRFLVLPSLFPDVKLAFLNCCKVFAMNEDQELTCLEQIYSQDGTLGKLNC